MKRLVIRISAALLAAFALIGGCTAPSVRAALEIQRRAGDVDEFIFDAQHDALKVLLFQRATAELEDAGDAHARAEALNIAWNDRDLFELWRVQHERAKTLRLIGVDLKLFADQSILDLLIKRIEQVAQQVKQRIAAQAGATAMGHAIEPSDSNGGVQ